MKSNALFFTLLFAFSINLFTIAKAQVNKNDSLALVDLYNSTNGPGWRRNSNWLTKKLVSTWYGITVRGTRVTGIDLYYNNLSGAIPASIGNCVSLEYLNLGNNQLSGAIPPCISHLVKLTGLFLFSNQLSDSIPASIGNCVNLKDLDVDDNQLRGAIPYSIGNCANLYSLNLSDNQLSGSIPLIRLRTLRYVFISNNRLAQTENIELSEASHPRKFIVISNNFNTFNGLEYLAHSFDAIYAPQDTILPVHQHGKKLAVYAGGTLSNNTYRWFKVGELGDIVVNGDSTFTPSRSGRYYAQVTNAIATQLTLYSDTIAYNRSDVEQDRIEHQIKGINTRFSAYPNPAKDIIQVQVASNAIITLTNAAGKVLLTTSINNKGEINVSTLANGTYYLQNKTTGETQKVVIVH